MLETQAGGQGSAALMASVSDWQMLLVLTLLGTLGLGWHPDHSGLRQHAEWPGGIRKRQYRFIGKTKMYALEGFSAFLCPSFPKRVRLFVVHFFTLHGPITMLARGILLSKFSKGSFNSRVIGYEASVVPIKTQK